MSAEAPPPRREGCCPGLRPAGSWAALREPPPLCPRATALLSVFAVGEEGGENHRAPQVPKTELLLFF